MDIVFSGVVVKDAFGVEDSGMRIWSVRGLPQTKSETAFYTSDERGLKSPSELSRRRQFSSGTNGRRNFGVSATGLGI